MRSAGVTEGLVIPCMVSSEEALAGEITPDGRPSARKVVWIKPGRVIVVAHVACLSDVDGPVVVQTVRWVGAYWLHAILRTLAQHMVCIGTACVTHTHQQ